ncbi:hypothetical protein [Halegenticoccus soli]|uniref:hypothetical protein n=1 Tax=Halegenticoccus soli TaxID=1985678 RepID=UPI001304174C|nr:hypothetical protein [Halegenticoccus soli]
MLLTEEGLCLDGTVSCFLLIPFKDDKGCRLFAAPTVTRTRRVRGVSLFGLGFVFFIVIVAWRLSFIETITRLR